MKRKILFALVGLFIPSICISANIPRGMALTNYIEKTLGNMAERHESAFMSACTVNVGSSDYTVRVIYFPRLNSGMLVYSTTGGKVLNSGDVFWDPNGQWDLSDLEGGMDTIKIVSNWFNQLTRLPFSWIPSEEVKDVLARKPSARCNSVM